MKNDELKNLAQKVLEDGYVMSLGTVDESGVWVSDVIYVHDENFNLYWISLPHSRHSKALEQNPKVACTVTASWLTNKERALQIEGVAEVATDVPFEYEQKLEAKRGREIPQVVGEVLANGRVWYVLKPTKVELIHSEPFGYEKKIIDLS